jgi:hypothetical protein
LLNSIGLALLPQLVPVEAQLGQYIGGIGQQVAVALIALAPMFDLHRHDNYREGRSFAASTSYGARRSALGGNRPQAEFLRRP